LRRQLLYLTNTGLTACMWQGGRLSSKQIFNNDELGWNGLSQFLTENPQVPALLLIDLIEEDFQRDTIPHVYGKARTTLIERRLEQLYRDTPFRNGVRQGREKGGRKDDHMLFSALTNAPLLRPWIDAIQKVKVPLAGIFSVALLSSLLFEKLRLGTGPVLLITHQTGGLRQSFFIDGYLKFSRLTQLSGQSPEEIAEIANAETTKTRQFLANTRLLQRGDTIDIVVVDNREALQQLQALNSDSAAANFRFFEIEEAARKLRLKIPEQVTVCDKLFLALLATRPPESHYTLFEQSRLYALWRTRIILYLLSAAVIIWAAFISGANFVDALDAAKRTRFLEQETALNQAHYRSIIASMPSTVAKPHDMKSAVDLNQAILQNSPTPHALLTEISYALNTLPSLKLNEIKWESTDKDPAGAQAVAAPVPGANPVDQPSLAEIGVPTTPFQIVTLKGEVLPFKEDYRSALENVDQLSKELMKDKHVQVTVTHPPLDVRPTVALTGQAGATGETPLAEFEIRVIWSP